jgi:sugar lactone lactonase YvrE
VTDAGNRKLVQYSKAGAVIREIKAVSPTADLRGIAVGPDGNLWVADRANKMIVKLSPTGTLLGSVTTAAMSEPWGVAFGPEGAMWVSDPGAHRLFKFQGSELKASVQDARLSWPIGITVDRFGNVWTAQQSPHRVLEFNSSGKFIFEFGSEGSGGGQLSWPTGIAIAKSGHLFVADAGNGRVQVFNTGGQFLRTFATPGSQTNQLSGPRDLAVGANNTLYVVDLGNKRVAVWNHADKDPQGGVAKLEIKVDGAAKETRNPGCATKNCALSGSWTMNADNYSVGKHKVELVATDGVGLATTKSYEVETHGDLTAPAIALSGSMTEQSTLGTTRPSYKLKAVATDPGSAEERQSGASSTSIKVDGTVVDSVAPGCTTGGCSITREWTLNSNSYAPGAHTVEVKATDAAGRWTNKTFSINIARDTTAPTFATLDPFYTAPEGWLEQKTYRIQSLVTDTNGYGVTSVQLKVDGAVVLSANQSCPAGGCSKTFGSEPPINMNLYSGGAHPAELIATDGALEAVEVTAPEAVELTPVGSLVVDAQGEDGSNPRLVLAEGELHSDGSPTPVTIDTNAKDGFAVETTGLDEDGSTSEGTIEVIPVQVNPAASPAELTDGSAAIISNSSVEADTILRPAYDGLQNFQAIRSAAAPEQYSWRVNMEPDQYLKLIDSQHAAVFWVDGPQAMLIRAPDAHGADGKAVATSVSVTEGNVITLTVHHRTTGVVYPVVAGIGWEGGFVYTPVSGPPPEEFEEEPPFEAVTASFISAPPQVFVSESSDPDASASATNYKYLKEFGAYQCEKVIAGKWGCGVWEQKLRGFFWFNYKKVWQTRQPACPKDYLTPLWQVNDAQTCAWVGPDWQRYGDGHHITAQVLYSVTFSKGVTVTHEHHLSVYAYGSGYWKDHDTDCICNPLPTD